MIAGLAVMTAVWWATPIAFTWYVLIGAVTTCAVAFVSRAAVAAAPHEPACAAFRRDRTDRRDGDRRPRLSWRGRSKSAARADRSRTFAAGTLSYAPGSPRRDARHDLRSRVADESASRTTALMTGEVSSRAHAPRRPRASLDRVVDRRGSASRHRFAICSNTASGLPAHRKYFESRRDAPSFELAIARSRSTTRHARSRSTATRDSCCSASRSKTPPAHRSIANSTRGAIASSARMSTCAIARLGMAPRIAPTEITSGWRRAARRSARRKRGGAWRRRRACGTVRNGRRGRRLRALVDDARLPCRCSRPGAPWPAVRARLDGTRCCRPRRAGRGCPLSAIGHTGFTGTSLWIDPASGSLCGDPDQSRASEARRRGHPGRAARAARRDRLLASEGDAAPGPGVKSSSRSASLNCPFGFGSRILNGLFGASIGGPIRLPNPGAAVRSWPAERRRLPCRMPNGPGCPWPTWPAPGAGSADCPAAAPSEHRQTPTRCISLRPL